MRKSTKDIIGGKKKLAKIDVVIEGKRKSTKKDIVGGKRKSIKKDIVGGGNRKSVRKSTRKSKRKSTRKSKRKSRRKSKGCKSGYIMRRKSYRTSTGKKVPAKCMKTSRLTKTQKKLYSTPNKKYIQKPKGNKKCPAGKIVRSAYTAKRKSGKSYKVPAKCVTDTGKRGRGPNVIKVKPKKGVLKQFGYSTKKSAEKRHEAIKKFIKAMNYDYDYVIRALNLVANYTKPSGVLPSNQSQKIANDFSRNSVRKKIRQMHRRKTHKIFIADKKFAMDLKKKKWHA